MTCEETAIGSALIAMAVDRFDVGAGVLGTNGARRAGDDATGAVFAGKFDRQTT